MILSNNFHPLNTFCFNKSMYEVNNWIKLIFIFLKSNNCCWNISGKYGTIFFHIFWKFHGIGSFDTKFQSSGINCQKCNPLPKQLGLYLIISIFWTKRHYVQWPRMEFLKCIYIESELNNNNSSTLFGQNMTFDTPRESE